VTRTCPTTETHPVLNPEFDAGTIPHRLDDSVQCKGVHYLRASRYKVNEDKGLYIPDILSDERYDYKQESFSAARDHAKHLTRAWTLVGDAMHLVSMMAKAACEKSDHRAMEIEVACDVIEKKLRKAYNRIDQHDRRHTNLFLAYVDLKEKTEGDESS
jgi:hypothetical protein